MWPISIEIYASPLKLLIFWWDVSADNVNDLELVQCVHDFLTSFERHRFFYLYNIFNPLAKIRRIFVMLSYNKNK